MAEILKQSAQILNKNDQLQNLKSKYKRERLQEAKQIYLCECQKVYSSFPALYLHVKNKHKLKLTTKINDKICKIERKDDKSYITYFLKDQTQFSQQKQDQNKNSLERNLLKNDGVKTSKGQGEDNCQHDNQYNSINRLSNPNYLMKSLIQNTNYLSLENVIEEFQRSKPAYSSIEIQFQSHVISLFYEYIGKVCQFSKQLEGLKKHNAQTFISQLPLFLNQFFSFYLPIMWTQSSISQMIKRKQRQIMKKFCDWLNFRGYTNLKTRLVLL